MRVAVGRLADPGTAVYRRGHGRRAPPPGQVVTAVDDAATGTGSSRRATRARISSSAAGRRSRRSTAGPRTGSSTDTAAGGRSARRSSSGGRDRCRGASPTRRAARSPRPGTRGAIEAFTAAVRDGLPRSAGRVSHLRIDPEIEADGPLDPDGALRRALASAGWRPAPPIQPNATRIIDLRADEEALWGDLRKKWRQYVNKARTGGVDGRGRRRRRGSASSTGSTARRRTGPASSSAPRSAYRDVWDAFAPAGNARLLFAQARRRRAAGDALPRPLRSAGRGAVRRDDRGRRASRGPTTCSSGRRSARRARPGATSYDLWGLATGGIAHFKTGFGGREVRYVGAWDLVLSRVGRQAYELAQRGPRRLGAAARRDPRRGERGGLRRRRLNVRDAIPAELADWDAPTVEAPGGHVYQSRAWAEHRRAGGWQPRFLVAGRRGPGARARRGPGRSFRAAAPTCRAGRWRWARTPAELGARLVAFGDALAADGRRRRRRGPRGPGRGCGLPRRDRGSRASARSRRSSRRATGSALGLDGRRRTRCSPAIAKSTRQRIRGAEETVERVVRHDGRAPARRAGRGVRRAERWIRGGARSVLRPAARDRRAAPFHASGRGRPSSAWWRAALGGRSPRLSRGPAGSAGRPVAGLVLYRHGGRLSTVHSGDHAATREEPSGRPPPPALAGHRARDPGGMHGDGPRRRRRRGRTRRASGGRPAVRPLPAQGVVRWPLAGADRRSRARLRRTRLPRGPPRRAGSHGWSVDDRPDARRAPRRGRTDRPRRRSTASSSA